MTMMSVIWYRRSLPLPSVNADCLGDWRRASRVFEDFELQKQSSVSRKGAIGFDWVTVSRGGVPWLISWPRKKLIKN